MSKPRQPAPTAPAAPVTAPLLTIAERRAQGKALRDKVRQDGQAGWVEAPDRRDPIDILIESGRSRVQRLLPVRTARMLESPFAFLRGSAAIMAADLQATPSSGIRVQACGDCHLMNFGVYASPEGRPVFDINDFDETLPAPFEWDVKRLASSIVLAGRHAGMGEKSASKAARAAVCAYREHVTELARLDPFGVWHSRIDVAEALKGLDDAKLRVREERRLTNSAGANPAYYDFPKLVGLSGGRWRIKDNPPLIFHFDLERDGPDALRATDVFQHYRDTLPEERRVLYDRYRLIDAAFKVVGVGSVGTFCAVGLFMTADEMPLLLQIKEAQPSVLAPYAGAGLYRNEGQRVVVGQRMMQTVSDIFLGWTQDGRADRHFYVRQLKDRKLAAIGESMQKDSLTFYARLCGTTLARAHARSGDAAMISGYLGSSEAFDAAIEEFAVDYADRSERDHRLLVDAVRSGHISANPDPLAG